MNLNYLQGILRASTIQQEYSGTQDYNTVEELLEDDLGVHCLFQIKALRCTITYLCVQDVILASISCLFLP